MCRATRRSSASPRGWSCQWWSESTAIAASNASSANGSSSAARVDHGRGAGRALGAHHRGRLHRDDLAVGGLVAPRSRADVHDAARVAQRRVDRRRDARVLVPRARVPAADVLVELGSLAGPAAASGPLRSRRLGALAVALGAPLLLLGLARACA